MKAYGIFIFALSLAVGVTAQGATNEVAAEVTARDFQMPYLDKRTVKLLRRKSSSSKGSSSSRKKNDSGSTSKVGNFCTSGLSIGTCRFDGSCDATDSHDLNASCF
ncbi:hypothetical protein M0657_011918 [Pyricularia oryzae]|uniref:Uncharacterized protein n=2 Tax=Pyricularia oryzae TaxID=318829 RepID=A0AA97NNM7_PYRO3|nr:hypothetical protein OOU_Y34scaffold00932g2 [Pyricularia oryzae Y34]KAI7909268.1 hypothetical protein M0657_011918 [Pyricularia oryzae]